MFNPEKETSDKCCFENMALYRRAQPDIEDEYLMLEM